MSLQGNYKVILNDDSENIYKDEKQSVLMEEEFPQLRCNDKDGSEDDLPEKKYCGGIKSNCNKNTKKKKKITLRSFLKGVIQVYYEYCANTSIHGVQYLGERRPKKEKCFWLCVFVISIFGCLNLINSVYVKWRDTPVIVSFDEKTTPIYSIPFPAITICSETKRVLQKDGGNFAKFFEKLKANEELKDLGETELDEFRTLLQICNTQLIDAGTPLLSEKKLNYFELLSSMLPEFERHFLFCKWFGRFGGCDELFVPTYTEEGICFTFNGLRAADLYHEDVYQHPSLGFTHNISKFGGDQKNRTLAWSLQNGYVSHTVDTYPVRVLAAGARAGLFIALQNYKHEIDYACRGPVQGFKVLLHSPDDAPRVSRQFVRIPMGKEILIAVAPNMITTSTEIASYEPLRRQCFLDGEKNLRFFKIYTQNNCETECLANFTLKKCGCVKFSMPRLRDTPVCAEDKINCYDSAEDDLLMREFNESVEDEDAQHFSLVECNCMPACTSLTYNTEISQANFDLEGLLDASGDTEFLRRFPGAQMSRLMVYFKEKQFITSKRSELYGMTNFLANCGGIFGLFMGFSILSMVEMLYHFSLRLYSNMMNSLSS